MESMRCGVCAEVYEVGSHDPLFLPCGHTFCRSCIISLHKLSKIECPACRREHHIQTIGSLPKNFALLSLSAFSCQAETCSVHGDPLRFWCTDCKEQVCGLCLFEDHPRESHQVLKTKTLMDEKKKALKAEGNRILNLAQSEAGTHEKSYARYEKKLLRLLKTNRDMCFMYDQIKVVIREALESMDISDILEKEDKLKSLSSSIMKVMNSSGHLCQNKCHTDDAETESARKTPDIQDVSEICMKPLTTNLRFIGGGNGVLQWDKERFILSAGGGEKNELSGGIQMIVGALPLARDNNHEVFLEIGSGRDPGEAPFGRVYIRLMKKLRRAQHFQALCLGLFGPCFRGSRLVAVKRRHEPEESVAGGDYLTASGEASARALMTDLEWGGPFAGERREGLVVGSSGGCIDEDARFGISTSRSASGQCQCPFGEVVDGLDVMRNALAFDRITDVVIRDCGIVVLHNPA